MALVSVTFWIILGAVAASDCHLPAAKLVGEPALAPALKSVPFPEPKGSVLGAFDQFQERFNDLYSIPSEKYQAEQRKRAFRWADGTRANLNSAERQELADRIREWSGILIRDVTATLDGDGQQLIAKRFVAFENLFAQKLPDMKGSFCLDSLVADSPEGAREVAKGLKVLKEKLVELDSYTAQMEKELITRLREHPEFQDHWYHYASFLFARGRLVESEAQLRELFKLNPKHPKGNALKEHIRVLQKVKNPVTRAKRISEITNTQLEEAAREYNEQRRRSPANRDGLPQVPKTDPSGKPLPTPEFIR